MDRGQWLAQRLLPPQLKQTTQPEKEDIMFLFRLPLVVALVALVTGIGFAPMANACGYETTTLTSQPVVTDYGGCIGSAAYTVDHIPINANKTLMVFVLAAPPSTKELRRGWRYSRPVTYDVLLHR